MTAPEQVASTAQEQAGAVAGTAKEQAASVAHTATSAAGEVTGTAKEQVGNVVGETVAQAKDLTGQVKEQAAQQVSSQTEKATTALRDVAKQLSEGDTSGLVGQVLGEVGTRVQTLADALEQKGPQGVLEDVRRYARRSPGTFLLGAALAGLVAGRLAKGLQSGSSQEQLALPAGPTGGTAAGNPLAGVTSPGVAAEVPTYGTDPYAASGSTGGAYAGDTGVYGSPATTPAPAYAPPTTPVSTPPPAYPSTGGSPYSAGYGQSEPYGSRGAL
ncbi:MAG: hypothetical protein JWM64_680 [Frankiales bacterium]|nr:hypothetical protein [Frankiales bacterium]